MPERRVAPGGWSAEVTIRSLGTRTPKIAATAWVSEAAYVVGDVNLGDGSSVWPGAVLRGDFGAIEVGAHTVIEDNCVVHTGERVSIGDNNIIGHGVIVHCARVGSNCLIGNQAVLLDDAVIGDYCLVAAGSLVLGRTVVPDRSFVAGSPATIEPIPDRYLQRLERQATPNAEGGYYMMARRYRDAGL
jgi:carbonic anhydrase/acetyltransferase-like protein (isoleucine patch superfamily)